MGNEKPQDQREQHRGVVPFHKQMKTPYDGEVRHGSEPLVHPLEIVVPGPIVTFQNLEYMPNRVG